MRKIFLFFVAILLTFSAINMSEATVYQPIDLDIQDLDHHLYYKWGFSIEDTEIITDITLSFDSIRNWDDDVNRLFVHLLDSAPLGLTGGLDDNWWLSDEISDQFAGQGELLGEGEPGWSFTSSPTNFTYTFSPEEVAIFNLYASDGNVALAFDPDCHFLNDGVSITTKNTAIPEPNTMILLGSSLIMFGAFRKLKRK